MSKSRTVSLATSNGVELGRVTRSTPVARRLPSTVRPIVVPRSRGAPIVERLEYSVPVRDR